MTLIESTGTPQSRSRTRDGPPAGRQKQVRKVPQTRTKEEQAAKKKEEDEKQKREEAAPKQTDGHQYIALLHVAKEQEVITRDSNLSIAVVSRRFSTTFADPLMRQAHVANKAGSETVKPLLRRCISPATGSRWHSERGRRREYPFSLPLLRYNHWQRAREGDKG